MSVRVSGDPHLLNSVALQEIALDDRVGPQKRARWAINIAGNHQNSSHAGFAAYPRDEVAEGFWRFIISGRNMRNWFKSSFAYFFCCFYQPQVRATRRSGNKNLRRGGKDVAERLEFHLI